MNRLFSTVSTIALGVGICASAHAQSGQGPMLDEIVVTATKKVTTAQDTALALQAIDEQTLDQLNVSNFDDYVRYLPNVTFGGRGPGQSTVYIRGMAVQPITVLLSGAQGTTPNVALYLDEQPLTAPGRNLDVYVADIDRVEVLPGPQGTLFGASSQAGTIRLISKKPVLDEFGAGFDATVSTTKDGEISHSQEAYLNLPILEDRLAARGVFYRSKEGGYIDNVPGTFTTDPSINPESQATPSALSYETASNQALVEEDFNDSLYEGFRISGLLKINEDWRLNVQHARQELEADGVFDFDPEVGDLEVTRFFDDSLDDKFNQTAWTLEGRLAMLDLVYTGAFLDREIDQSVDYTGYNNSGAFISYYTCTYSVAYLTGAGLNPSLGTVGGRQCLDPTKGAVIKQEQSRMTHEFRVSTPQEWRLRAIGGVFYDDYEIETQDDFFYLATDDLGFAPNAPISTAVQINPATRPPGVAFFNDIRRTEEQIALFGEVSFDIIPDVLTLTGGMRYYNIESDFEGSSNFADGPFQSTPVTLPVNLDRGRDYDVSGGHSTEPLTTEGVVYKGNLSWTPTDDLLFYATYSQGFRPGGFNRGGGLPSANPLFPTVETTYRTDDVVNYELGWKTQFLNNSLQFNGSAYFIEWTDMQVSRFDPQNVSILTFIENAADSEIFGIEGDVAWAATNALTLFGAFSYNDTEITDVQAQVVEIAPVGSQLPLVPEWQFTTRGRYERPVYDFNVYFQAGLQYSGESFSSLVAAVREAQESYVTADLSAGVTRNRWGAELFVENVSDTRAELFINEQDDIRRITTNRPRTIGLKISFDY